MTLIDLTLTDDEAIALRTAIASRREYAVPEDLESGLEKLDAALASTDIGPKFDRYPEWCPVCHSYHNNVGVKTDAGKLIRQCPSLSPHDPRNIFKNYPGR